MLFGHGDDYFISGKEITANFSSNVWYGANLDSLKEHLFSVFTSLSRYPEPDAASLKHMLADVYGVNSSNILVTNGSITAFYMLAQTWKGENSTIIIPSFAEYEDACKLYEHNITYVENSKPLESLDLHNQKLCWICNPNNPDGHLWNKTSIERLIESNPETLFVLDQAYSEFVRAEMISPSDINRHKNLILVRSISKVHKIPGLRIGYIVASEKIIDKVSHFIIPWSVNSIAIEAGKYVLSNPGLFEMPLASWKRDTDILMRKLSEIEDIEVMPSTTTFFLVRLKKGKSSDLKKFLVEKYGLLIRDASNFRGLTDAHFRISAQQPEYNDLLVVAIKDWLGQIR